jgi:peptide/nickel transport system substrate-binding protein
VDRTRRTLLGLVGGGAAVGLAGCLGDDDEGNGNGDTPTETPMENGDDDMENGDDDMEETPTETPSEDDMSEDDDGGNGQDGPPEEALGGELNAISATISTFDPIAATDTASTGKFNQAYENLTHYPNGETRLENQLLTEVEISDDLLTYTFSIQEGVPYHDNPIKDELTAQDFKYAWRRLAESDSTAFANYCLEPGFLGIDYESDEESGLSVYNIVPDSLAVEVIDDYTLEMTLQEIEPAALDILAYEAFAAMPEGLVGDIQGYDGEYSQEEIASSVMVGTGPFELDYWESGSEVRMTAFDDYWGEGPYLDSLHWAVIEEDEAAYTYSMEKNSDFVVIPTGQYDSSLIDAEPDDRGRQYGTYGPVENDEVLEYVGIPQLSTYYVAFNAPQVPRPVRRAIAYVTNHEELINEVFKGRGQEAFSFTPPAMWPGGFDNYTGFRDNWPYGMNETNIDQAQQVLEEAGFTPDDPFEVTLTVYSISDAFQQFGRLTRDKLAGTGINLQLEEAPFGSLIERGSNGDLAFYSLGWIWSWVDPAYGLYGFEPGITDTSREGGADGYYLDWNGVDTEPSQTAQEAWETIENNPAPEDEDIRNENFVEMERAVREDMVLLPLYHGLGESFRYQWVNAPRGGALGSHRSQSNTTWLDADAPNR